MLNTLLDAAMTTASEFRCHIEGQVAGPALQIPCGTLFGFNFDVARWISRLTSSDHEVEELSVLGVVGQNRLSRQGLLIRMMRVVALLRINYGGSNTRRAFPLFCVIPFKSS